MSQRMSRVSHRLRREGRESPETQGVSEGSKSVAG